MQTKQEMIDYIVDFFNDFAVYNLYWDFDQTKDYYVKLFKYHQNDTIIRVKLQKKRFLDTLERYEYYDIFKAKNIKYLTKNTLETIIFLIDCFKSSLFS